MNRLIKANCRRKIVIFFFISGRCSPCMPTTCDCRQINYFVSVKRDGTVALVIKNSFLRKAYAPELCQKAGFWVNLCVYNNKNLLDFFQILNFRQQNSLTLVFDMASAQKFMHSTFYLKTKLGAKFSASTKRKWKQTWAG